jgi:hypothetical protein
MNKMVKSIERLPKPIDSELATKTLFDFYNKRRVNKSVELILTDFTDPFLRLYLSNENIEANKENGVSLLKTVIDAVFSLGIEQGMRIHNERLFKELPDLKDEEQAIDEIKARLAQLRKDGHIK